MTTRKEEKMKYKITIDAMLIVGKYFETNEDYINIMKTCKRYHNLTEMYHFNPISDCSLFENMESQYFYTEEETKERNEQIYLFVLCELFKNEQQER